MSTPSNTYIDLSDTESGGGHPINLWWSPDQPERIHLVLDDPRFVNDQGEKPGLRLVLSSNPKSADYSPANFNRCARLLRAAGRPAPREVVHEHPRHLRYREHVIAAVLSSDSAITPLPEPLAAATALSNAEVCEICWCYVADLEKHSGETHP